MHPIRQRLFPATQWALPLPAICLKKSRLEHTERALGQKSTGFLVLSLIPLWRPLGTTRSGFTGIAAPRRWPVVFGYIAP